jgi:hypothetical protein
VEALELAEGLRMVGTGGDELDTRILEPALEGDLDSEQAPREDGAVVGQALTGQAVAGRGGAEAGPGGLARRRGAGERAQQEPGVVVEAVDDPSLAVIGEHGLGGVDLPEVVGALALEALARTQLPRRLRETSWLRLSTWCTVEVAGASIPARLSSARLRLAPQRGCARRSSQISASSRGSMRLGETCGRRERGSSPAMPSSPKRRR